jgi:hypothetical protein
MEGKEFGLTVSRKLNEIKARPGDVISFSAWFMAADSVAPGQLVISFEEGGQTMEYKSTPSAAYNTHPGHWQKMRVTAEVPETMSAEGQLKCYFWNPDKKKISIDDLSLETRSMHYYR